MWILCLCGCIGNCAHIGADVDTLAVPPDRDRTRTFGRRNCARYLHKYSTYILCGQNGPEALAGFHQRAENRHVFRSEISTPRAYEIDIYFVVRLAQFLGKYQRFGLESPRRMPPPIWVRWTHCPDIRGIVRAQTGGAWHIPGCNWVRRTRARSDLGLGLCMPGPDTTAPAGSHCLHGCCPWVEVGPDRGRLPYY
jgi:hypothetical protein